MEGRPAKHILLILARELAVNLATPLLVVDDAATLVFFNEAAELLLGRSFGATGELPAEEWTRLFTAETGEGASMPAQERPLAAALLRRVPVHRRMALVGGDGVRRRLVVTAYPLMPDRSSVVGAIAIFWEDGPERTDA